MIATGTIIDSAGDQLGGFLPRLGGAIVLLIAGLLVAWLLGKIVRRALEAAGADRLGERWRVHDSLDRLGLGRSLARLIGRAVRIGITIVAAFGAISLLGLQFLSTSLNQVLLFLPNVLVALALLLGGFILGGFVAERADRLAYQMDLPVPLGRLAQAAIVAVFALTAAAQLAIPTAILMALGLVLVGATALTFTLAFGLGGRAVAQELSAGRYVSGPYAVGQTISVGDHRGEIVALDSTAVVLDGGDGRRLRVPNRMLLDTVVTVHTMQSPPAPGGEASV
jgi:small-conductance mechanosensitive channel